MSKTKKSLDRRQLYWKTNRKYPARDKREWRKYKRGFRDLQYTQKDLIFELPERREEIGQK